MIPTTLTTFINRPRLFVTVESEDLILNEDSFPWFRYLVGCTQKKGPSFRPLNKDPHQALTRLSTGPLLFTLNHIPLL